MNLNNIKVIDGKNIYGNDRINREKKELYLNNEKATPQQNSELDIYLKYLDSNIKTLITDKKITSVISIREDEIYYLVDSYIENNIEQRPNDIYYSLDGKLTPRSKVLIDTIGEKVRINELKTKLNELSKFDFINIAKTKAEKEGNFSLLMGYTNLNSVVEQKFGIIDKVD